MIYSQSKFNYGQTSTLSTQSIPFKEGSSSTQLTALIPIGSYSLVDYAQAVADSMNSVGSLVYTVTIDRSTNILTISAPSAFTLLTNQSNTAFPMMGFTQNAVLSGQSSYSGNVMSGYQYVPQFLLQSYVPASNFARSVSPSINESASGLVEVVRFGVTRFIEFELQFITNLRMDGTAIKNDQNGVANVLAFLDFAVTKAPFEFVPDLKNPSNFTEVILESTEAASDGTGYKLIELFADSIPDVYRTGLLTLRVNQ